MPETVKRSYVSERPTQPVNGQKRQGGPTGPSYPNNPHTTDGKFENTAAGKTKQKGF